MTAIPLRRDRRHRRPARTIAEEVEEIVARETRRALREREDDLTKLVRTAVASAIAEMLAAQ